jgi:DNA-binding NarL/FixJ family response regulator
MRPVTLLLVDQHDNLRGVLAQRLHALSGFAVVGETASPLRGVDLAAIHRPDVILFDTSTPGAYAADLCARIRRASPDSRLVVFSAYFTPSEEEQYRASGADKCLLKGMAINDLAAELSGLVRAQAPGA